MERDRPDCANILLDYAKSKGLPVTFKCEEDDLLSRAIANESEDHVEYVLDKLTGKYATMAETIKILNEHLRKFLPQFPRIAHKFLKDDEFVTDYARFEVPEDLFGIGNIKIPMVIFTRDHPASWQVMDSRAAKDVWIRNSAYAEELSDTNSPQMRVVAKFSCIHPGDLHAAYYQTYVHSSVRLN